MMGNAHKRKGLPTPKFVFVNLTKTDAGDGIVRIKPVSKLILTLFE